MPYSALGPVLMGSVFAAEILWILITVSRNRKVRCAAKGEGKANLLHKELLSPRKGVS